MREEILDRLPQEQAGVVLTSAADRARSTARERLHAFASSPNEVNVSALANWCQRSARLYIRTVLAGHDNDHDAYDNTIRSAKQSR
jgi:Tfp pilus assembly protein FimT